MYRKADLIDKKVTPDFYAMEWFVSNDHPEVAERMEMPESCYYKLIVMGHTILQPVRDRFGPTKILSGYRTLELNGLVGGSSTSQHLDAEAADILPLKINPYPVAQWIKDRLSFAWWQLILYLDNNRKPRFIHVSLPPERPRKRKAALVKIGRVYLPWDMGIESINPNYR
jgi:hypothetical protein